MIVLRRTAASTLSPYGRDRSHGAQPPMEHLNLMRRILTLSMLGLMAGVVGACTPEEVVKTEDIPTAGVRFINAVPDTGAMDFRFVDQVESNAHWGVAFRNAPTISGGVPASTTVQYKNARAGSRTFKIFMNGGCTPTACNQAAAMDEIATQTVTLEAGKLYTALLWGYANPTRAGSPAGLPAGAPPMVLDFYEETVADPGTSVALRVINATAAPVDASFFPSAGTAPGTPTWAAVPAMSRSTYQTTAAAQYRYSVTGVTQTANLALVGTAATTIEPGPFDPIPGTTIAGSAVTAIVWPRSVAGTQAPQNAASATLPGFTVSAITFVWDRRPPRPAGI